MKVSVIVPVYNVEKYIEKCLLSIKNQTLDDFECLVINDGTKDDSVEIAKKTINGDNRFVFFDKENGGLSDARNYGTERASGEYICFVDSDDYIDENLLKLSYETGKRDNSDIVCFDLCYIWEDGRKEISAGADFNEVSNYTINPSIIFSNNSANNKLYKSSFIKGKRFISGMWYEDLAIVPVWIAQANQMSYVKKPLYFYVQREGSITHVANEKIFDIYNALESIQDNLHLKPFNIKNLYFNNALIMTTLRIKEFDDKKTRIEYYKKNIELLNLHYPDWYKDIKNEKEYSLKQRIVFLLLKNNQYGLIDSIYASKKGK